MILQDTAGLKLAVHCCSTWQIHPWASCKGSCTTERCSQPHLCQAGSTDEQKLTREATASVRHFCQFRDPIFPQNHSTAELGRDLWRSSSATLPLKQGHLQPVVQDHVQRAFNYLQGWRLHNLSGHPVPVLGHLHSEKGFLDIQREPPVFQFLLIASGPVTGHHWKEPGSVTFSPSPLVFTFFKKSFASRHICFSYIRCSSPLIILMARYWFLSSMSMSVLYWEAQNWTQCSRCVLTSTE